LTDFAGEEAAKNEKADQEAANRRKNKRKRLREIKDEQNTKRIKGCN
jgi:hypothetical protein